VPDVGGLNRLSSVLIGLYPGVADTRALADRAGLRLGNIDLSGPPRVFVWNVVREANLTGRLDRLIDTALEDYPDQPDLVDAREQHYDRLPAPVASPALPPDRWRPRLGPAQVEKLMGATSTFLPVSFLALGLERSRAVARVVLPDLSTGTGFLVDGNRLVTNHHVLPDAATARTARLQLNVQESSTGRPEPVTEVGLDPDAAFVTSPLEGGHDYTIVAVAEDVVAEWGALPLHPDGTVVGGRVVIVQHPEGGFKKIALQNNLVTYVDEDVLQYLTDTLPGSSGSPVFDQSWRVVGLHHAGGDVLEPRSGRTVFRNEGIQIRHVLTALEQLGQP
jgi:V8-like Glu-specific endopeptidase